MQQPLVGPASPLLPSDAAGSALPQPRRISTPGPATVSPPRPAAMVPRLSPSRLSSVPTLKRAPVWVVPGSPAQPSPAQPSPTQTGSSRGGPTLSQALRAARVTLTYQEVDSSPRVLDSGGMGMPVFDVPLMPMHAGQRPLAAIEGASENHPSSPKVLKRASVFGLLPGQMAADGGRPCLREALRARQISVQYQDTDESTPMMLGGMYATSKSPKSCMRGSPRSTALFPRLASPRKGKTSMVFFPAVESA